MQQTDYINNSDYFYRKIPHYIYITKQLTHEEGSVNLLRLHARLWQNPLNPSAPKPILWSSSNTVCYKQQHRGTLVNSTFHFSIKNPCLCRKVLEQSLHCGWIRGHYCLPDRKRLPDRYILSRGILVFVSNNYINISWHVILVYQFGDYLFPEFPGPFSEYHEFSLPWLVYTHILHYFLLPFPLWHTLF